MKIFLPSNNMMGYTSVDMRNPKIGDLREVPNMSESSVIKKTQYVELLTGPIVRKVSPSDRDYLFLLGVGAVSMNRISMGVQCDCKAHIMDSFSIGELEPRRLSRGVKRCSTYKIYGKKYSFTKISVEDEIHIEERALDLPDETYEEEWQDGLVALTLGWGLESDAIKRVRDLDLSLYYAAVLYQALDPHGVSLVKECRCPKCDKTVLAHLPVKGDILNVDVNQLMQRYVSVRENISMESFFDVTLPEYNTFIDALNAKLK